MTNQRQKSFALVPGPVRGAHNVLKEFQNGARIQRPNAVQSLIPVIGPAWDAAADLQERDYGGALFNGAMAAAELLPVGVAVRGARMASKGIGALKHGSVTADAARKQMRARGVVPDGYEIHHTRPIHGLSRNAQDERNHYMWLKPLPIEQHRRLRGRWNGKPRYGPVGRAWHGTNDWQKAGPTAFGAYMADFEENAVRRSRQKP